MLTSSGEWIPTAGIELEENAEKVVRSTGNMLVSAGPGTGKTELLAQRACYLLETGICAYPQRILAISFKNDAASNLKERVDRRCGRRLSSRFDPFTFDGFCKMLIDQYRYALPESCRPKGDYVLNDEKRLKEVFASAKQSTWDSIVQKATLPLTDDTSANQYWKALLKGDGGQPSVLSFKMVEILAEYLLDTVPAVTWVLRSVYSHIFVDEYQDTTEWQYRLLSKITRGTSIQVTAVGDCKQRIMLWAGAMRDAFTRFRNDYDAGVKQLLVNHRSSPRLVDLQKRLYASLGEDAGGVTATSDWKPSDGSVQLVTCEDESEEANKVAEQISLRIGEGVNPEQICVICKQKVEELSKPLELALLERGIRLRSDRKVLDIQSDGLSIFVLLLFRRSIAGCSPQQEDLIAQAVSMLYGFDEGCAYEDAYEVKQELDELCSSVKSALDAEKDDRMFCSATCLVAEHFGQQALLAAFPGYSCESALTAQLAYLVKQLNIEFKLLGDAVRAIDSLLGVGVIPAMTIHRSKGLEFEYVFFLGLEDSAFWNFRQQPEEDRCAFFVALSRAVRGVTFTFCKYRNHKVQTRTVINEFYVTLTESGIAELL